MRFPVGRYVVYYLQYGASEFPSVWEAREQHDSSHSSLINHTQPGIVVRPCIGALKGQLVNINTTACNTVGFGTAGCDT